MLILCQCSSKATLVVRASGVNLTYMFCPHWRWATAPRSQTQQAHVFLSRNEPEPRVWGHPKWKRPGPRICGAPRAELQFLVQTRGKSVSRLYSLDKVSHRNPRAQASSSRTPFDSLRLKLNAAFLRKYGLEQVFFSYLAEGRQRLRFRE